MSKEKDLNYWLRQVRLVEQSRERDAEKKLKRIYKNLLDDLNGFIGGCYARYADADGILTGAVLQQKINRAHFLEEVLKRVDSISPHTSALIRKTAYDTYERCYEGMIKAVGNAYGAEALSKAFKGASLRPEVIKSIIESPINRLTLPDRLQRSRNEVVYRVRSELAVGMMNGDRYDTAAKKIAKQLDISYGKAINTVRTETHRAREGGLMDAAELAAKELESSGMIYAAIWRTRKDERVRPNSRYHTKSKGWRTKKRRQSGGGIADHMKMEGAAVRVGENFELEPGIYAKHPGASGVARHDCNCRCFLQYTLMSAEEFAEAEKLSGGGAFFMP